MARYLYACIPRTEPTIGAKTYATLNELIPSATAGLSTPFEPNNAAIVIPSNSEPPPTTPDMTFGVLLYTSDAIPKAKNNVPKHSAITTFQLLSTIISGIPTVNETTAIATAPPIN